MASRARPKYECKRLQTSSEFHFGHIPLRLPQKPSELSAALKMSQHKSPFRNSRGQNRASNSLSHSGRQRSWASGLLGGALVGVGGVGGGGGVLPVPGRLGGGGGGEGGGHRLRYAPLVASPAGVPALRRLLGPGLSRVVASCDCHWDGTEDGEGRPLEARRARRLPQPGRPRRRRRRG